MGPENQKIQSPFKCLHKTTCKSKVSSLSFSLCLSPPSPPTHPLLILCPPLSVHSSSLRPLICSPVCSTASRPAPRRRSRAAAARIYPRTSRCPASCLWMDGTAKRGGGEKKELRVRCLFAFAEHCVKINVCSLRHEGENRQVAPAGHGHTSLD